MPRGGVRVGAGRKPNAKAVVLGMDGARRPEGVAASAVVPTPPAVELTAPPVDLLPDEQAFWRLYAPYAIEQRTLVQSTVAGFRELCEQFALKQAIAASIAKLKGGAASKRAEGKLRTYVKLAQRLDSTLARFKLTSFGKPADGSLSGRKPVANPWAAVAGK